MNGCRACGTTAGRWNAPLCAQSARVQDGISPSGIPSSALGTATSDPCHKAPWLSVRPALVSRQTSSVRLSESALGLPMARLSPLEREPSRRRLDHRYRFLLVPLHRVYRLHDESARERTDLPVFT